MTDIPQANLRPLLDLLGLEKPPAPAPEEPYDDSWLEWWRKPVPGWPHELRMRNMATGLEVVIPLRGEVGET